ncbi:hypothetical protein LTS10_003661 [Elasticomyces elasticus]|nr:hypothetical protein LTS10_003661 [Elasticomyces elasticus]
MNAYEDLSWAATHLTLSDGVYTIYIKSKSGITISGVGKIVPSSHSGMTVLLAGKPGLDDSDTFFQGEVCDITPTGYEATWPRCRRRQRWRRQSPLRVVH